ncbi:ethanolamine ammonia-lyase subunit EutC [Rhodoplanes azumiensis]|uniref:Ethanolamine ammonia-lyase small subunit n=1 Tax=Rhodoplanes azumiensis TaxID=1897628 RepID=A0ABW5AI29_9BRAD
MTEPDLSKTSTAVANDADPWAGLRRLTAARIGLPRAGASLATAPLLEFRLAHARARDAVHAPFAQARLHQELVGLGLPVVSVASAAADRHAYLMRPDLGRRLAPEAGVALAAHAATYDLAIVVTDGLSAQAVERHAGPVLAAVLPALLAHGWRVAPLVVVRHGRVAIGDAVAGALGAESVVVLIGERPGLSAPDSMGAYVTWRPRDTTTDADRNCLSNIRPDGIAPADAAFKLTHLLREMRVRRLSGVMLKDSSDVRSVES